MAAGFAGHILADERMKLILAGDRNIDNPYASKKVTPFFTPNSVAKKDSWLLQKHSDLNLVISALGHMT